MNFRRAAAPDPVRTGGGMARNEVATPRSRPRFRPSYPAPKGGRGRYAYQGDRRRRGGLDRGFRTRPAGARNRTGPGAQNKQTRQPQSPTPCQNGRSGGASSRAIRLASLKYRDLPRPKICQRKSLNNNRNWPRIIPWFMPLTPIRREICTPKAALRRLMGRTISSCRLA